MQSIGHPDAGELSAQPVWPKRVTSMDWGYTDPLWADLVRGCGAQNLWDDAVPEPVCDACESLARQWSVALGNTKFIQRVLALNLLNRS